MVTPSVAAVHTRSHGGVEEQSLNTCSVAASGGQEQGVVAVFVAGQGIRFQCEQRRHAVRVAVEGGQLEARAALARRLKVHVGPRRD